MDAEDARCLLHEAQREAAALREQASALTEEREAMTASLIHTKEAAVRALRCISTPKKSSPSARSPERVAPSKGKGTERRTPSTVLLDAFNSPDSPVSPPQLLHTRRALSDSQEQREEYEFNFYKKSWNVVRQKLVGFGCDSLPFAVGFLHCVRSYAYA